TQNQGCLDGAVHEYLCGRIYPLLHAAKPLWQPPTEARGKHVRRAVFVNFNRGANRLNYAITDVADQAKQQSGINVQVQPGGHFPPSRLECVSLALGGELDWFARPTEVKAYREAMDGLGGADPDGTPTEEPFAHWYRTANPHIERQYQEAGLRWLAHQALDEKGSSLGESAGEFVEALACFSVATHPNLFHYLDRTGAIMRTFRRVGNLYGPDEKIGPKGVSKFAAWLEGSWSTKADPGEQGKALASELKDLMWKDLQMWMMGSPTSDPPMPPTPLGKVIDELRSYGLKLKGTDGKSSDALTKRLQGEGIMVLVEELQLDKGEKRPTSLKN
ncbi:MAG: hypothetical protein QGG40_10615, partial [Myxococcota bacterium]|nr:hypothetical protein [Myxococcota bacterium]